VKRVSAARARGGGLARFRWILAAVIAAVLILVVILTLLNTAISRKSRLLQDRILEENRTAAASAASGAALFERYLSDGAPGAHVVSGAALHRFIEKRYGSTVPDSIGPWRIVLSDGLALVEGVVDLEAYLLQMGMEQPVSLGTMAGQEIPFGFRGRLDSSSGMGRFVIEEVTLLGLPLPLDLVERVAGSSADGSGSVLIQQFPLPDGIVEAVIEGDRMVIHGVQPE
jgi:hypothetical protein